MARGFHRHRFRECKTGELRSEYLSNHYDLVIAERPAGFIYTEDHVGDNHGDGS